MWHHIIISIPKSSQRGEAWNEGEQSNGRRITMCSSKSEAEKARVDSNKNSF